MRIKFLAAWNAPFFYEFEGDVITAFYKDEYEDIDLSALETGDILEDLEPEVLKLDGAHILRHAYRDESGELHVTLCQKAPMYGHWTESLEYDVSEYVEGRTYIRQKIGDDIIDPVFPEPIEETPVIPEPTVEEEVQDAGQDQEESSN